MDQMDRHLRKSALTCFGIATSFNRVQKGFTRAMYQHLQHWLRERRTRARAGGGVSILEGSPRTTGAEKMVVDHTGGETVTRLPPVLFRPAKFFEA
jgi:hypothetical protein